MVTLFVPRYDHPLVTPDGGFGRPSSVTRPVSVTGISSCTATSGPASTTGAWFVTGPVAMAKISSALNATSKTRTSSTDPFHEAGLPNAPLPTMNCGQFVSTPDAVTKPANGWSSRPLT